MENGNPAPGPVSEVVPNCMYHLLSSEKTGQAGAQREEAESPVAVVNFTLISFIMTNTYHVLDSFTKMRLFSY